jgi:hypothetical protein
MLPEVRRDRQRTAAYAYGEFLRGQPVKQTKAAAALIEASNDIALHGSEW